MDMLLRFQCPGCGKSFIVDDGDVEGAELSCPHCCDDVPVPDDEEPDDEE